MNYRKISSLLPLLLIFGCQPAEKLDYPFRSLNELAREQDHPEITLGDLYSEPVVQVLSEAQEILIIRVGLYPQLDEETGEINNMLEIEAGPHLLEGDLRDTVRSTVLKIDHYGEPYNCPFEPQLMIRFRYTPDLAEESEEAPGPEQVDVLVNLNCAEIMVFFRGIPANPNTVGISHDFFRIIGQAAESHFPTDPEFRGLSDL